MKVRVYGCRTFDAILQTWEKSRFKYTLEEIAGFAHAEPVMDEWEDVERPSLEEQRRNSTSAMFRNEK